MSELLHKTQSRSTSWATGDMYYVFHANIDIYYWRIFYSILFHANVLSLQKNIASLTKNAQVHRHTLARACTPAVKATVQQSRGARPACIQWNVRAPGGAQGRSVICWRRDQVLNLSSDPAAKTTSSPRTFRHAALESQFLRCDVRLRGCPMTKLGTGLYNGALQRTGTSGGAKPLVSRV